MITDLWIENFKGIGKRQHIPLKPITLLFGANSAGKSTVLHALQYLHEIFVNRQWDGLAAVAGEDTVSLGGFQRLVHRTTGSKTPYVKLGLRLAVSDAARAHFKEKLKKDFAYLQEPRSSWDSSVGGLEPLAPSQIDCEMSVVWNQSLGMPTIESFVINANLTPFARFDLQPSGLAKGWVSLTSQLWGTPALPFSGSELSLSLLEKWTAYSDSLLQWLHGNITDSVATKICKVASQLLQCPRVEEWHGSLEAIREKLDAIDLVEVPWATLIDFLNPYEAEFYTDDLKQFLCESNACFLLSRDVANAIYQAAEQNDIVGCIRTLVPPIALVAEASVSLGTLDDLIGVFRHFWTRALFEQEEGREHPSPFQGNWTHAFLTDFGGTTIPQPHRKMRMEPTGGILPGFGYDYERKDRLIDLVEVTPATILQAAVNWIREELTARLYVGPKRATVPRYLSSQTMEPFTHWGTGLGAWKWLLETSEVALKLCSDWLQQLGENAGSTPSGYQLVREDFYEVTLSQIETLSLQPGADYYGRQRRLFIRQQSTGLNLHPQEVGEGITQVVPVLAAACRMTNADKSSSVKSVAIEQPELHLHPSLSARLGDVFLQCAMSFDDRRLLIETHSEHLILRILRRIRQTTNGELPDHIPPVRPDDVCVLWVDNLGDGTTFQRLRIDEQGEFIDRWPMGFFSERAEELY